eukprot:Sspe_Gene.108364::Locus_87499_Transcript_1_1_Confidence_1.000_Length_1078::g.108364::m.108364
MLRLLSRRLVAVAPVGHAMRSSTTGAHSRETAREEVAEGGKKIEQLLLRQQQLLEKILEEMSSTSSRSSTSFFRSKSLTTPADTESVITPDTPLREVPHKLQLKAAAYFEEMKKGVKSRSHDLGDSVKAKASDALKKAVQKRQEMRSKEEVWHREGLHQMLNDASEKLEEIESREDSQFWITMAEVGAVAFIIFLWAFLQWRLTRTRQYIAECHATAKQNGEEVQEEIRAMLEKHHEEEEAIRASLDEQITKLQADKAVIASLGDAVYKHIDDTYDVVPDQ